MPLDQRHWILESYSQRMDLKEWKKILLEGRDKIIFHGNMRILKGRSLGFGVVEVYKIPKDKSDKILFGWYKMKFDQKEFNFNPYLFRVDEELNYKNLKAKFPENFNYMEKQFDIIKKLYGIKYIKTTFEVRDILANSFMKVVIKKYYEEDWYKMSYKFNPKKKCFYYVDYNEIEELNFKRYFYNNILGSSRTKPFLLEFSGF